ncbi:hypothetical protein VUR80DRAFT_749 [Thermomyces stellatus]
MAVPGRDDRPGDGKETAPEAVKYMSATAALNPTSISGPSGRAPRRGLPPPNSLRLPAAMRRRQRYLGATALGVMLCPERTGDNRVLAGMARSR